MIKIKKVFLVLFVITIVTILLFEMLQSSKNNDIQNLSNKSIQITQIAYDAIIDTYKVVSKKCYHNLMDNVEVMELLKEFKYASDDEKKILRGRLYRLLINKYKELKLIDIRQFHFHTHEGKSLLRFHKPEDNGDPLMSIRTSIKYVNSELKPIFGFEGGRIYPGFRYVYPIIYKNDHLGSVEFSISFEAIESKLKEVLPTYIFQLILNKNESVDKVFQCNKKFFLNSPFGKDHFIENRSISKVTQNISENNLLNELNKLVLQSDSFLKKLDSGSDFSVPVVYDGSGYIVNFITVYGIDKKESAHIVSYGRFDELLKIERKYTVFYIIEIIAMIVIAILILIVLYQFEKLLKQKDELTYSNTNLQHLLDMQNNIVILSDGSDITYANKKFFKFFNFKQIEDFKAKYRCICEMFIEQKNFFSLKKVQDDENWLDVIQELPPAQRVVAMHDRDSKLNLFSVSISMFKGHLYIITFTNITQTMNDYMALEEKTIHDKLTNAFNREYFDKNYERLIGKFSDENHKMGISIMDIDHFKNVNDTYGHDVGDKVLIELVKTIHKYSRHDDTLIRWGGEEFVMILKVESSDSLEKALENIRSIIEKSDFIGIKKITCSFGATIYEMDEDINTTLKRADEALYEAKSSGRNRVVIF